MQNTLEILQGLIVVKIRLLKYLEQPGGFDAVNPIGFGDGKAAVLLPFKHLNRNGLSLISLYRRQRLELCRNGVDNLRSPLLNRSAHGIEFKAPADKIFSEALKL